LDGIGDDDDVIVVDDVLLMQYWPVIPATFDFFFIFFLVNKSRFLFIVMQKKLGKLLGILELGGMFGDVW
jgi:hypothetical protein